MKKVPKKKQLIYGLFLFSLTFFFLYLFFWGANEDGLFHTETIIKSKKSRDFMISALEIISKEKESKGIRINAINDPNNTGLIGSEYSMITTTLGHLDAKRTSVNPDTAALVCSLFLNEGLNPGDTVAIGSSASFPGLLLATLSACETLGLKPLTIVSFGASQYGANETDFTIIEILGILERHFGKLFTPLAISYGGNNDIADDLSEEAQAFIRESIQKTNYRLIYNDDFRENVQERMTLYHEMAETEIQMFVNIGGSLSNIGNGPEVLNLRPGMNKEIEQLPAKENRGVLFEFASLKVPVLHLLYMKGLSVRYGLAWDPIPFQNDSYQNFFIHKESDEKSFLLFFFIFVSTLSVFILIGKFLFKSQG